MGQRGRARPGNDARLPRIPRLGADRSAERGRTPSCRVHGNRDHTPTAWLLRNGVPVIEVSFGTRLPMMGIQGSIALLGLPGSEVLDAPLTAVAITSSTAAAGRPTGAAVIASLRQFLGIRYLWAGTSGFGFDCSGLVYNVFRAHGVLLPRDAQDQALVGTAVSRQSLQ